MWMLADYYYYLLLQESLLLVEPHLAGVTVNEVHSVRRMSLELIKISINKELDMASIHFMVFVGFTICKSFLFFGS